MKKVIFVYNFGLFLLIFTLGACDSGTRQQVSESSAKSADTVLVEGADDETAAEDVDLVLLAFMNNRLQYHMSDIASEKASSEEVKTFAETLMGVEEEARVKLEELAQVTNTNLPQAIGADQKVNLDSISNLEQQQFDKAYLTKVVNEYDENIDLLNELISKGDNPIVSGLVADIKDFHEEHMLKATSLLEELS